MVSNPELNATIDFFGNLLPTFKGTLTETEQRTRNVLLERSSSINTKGYCYIFGYSNPKGYETNTLKYHHIFPASIVFDISKTHITAINPFYMPPQVRKYVMPILLKNLVGKKSITLNDKVEYNYDAVNPTDFGRVIRPAIKKYIRSRMSSEDVRISPSLWLDVYLGKTSKVLNSQFSGATPQEVYRDYKIRFLKGT